MSGSTAPRERAVHPPRNGQQADATCPMVGEREGDPGLPRTPTVPIRRAGSHCLSRVLAAWQGWGRGDPFPGSSCACDGEKAHVKIEQGPLERPAWQVWAHSRAPAAGVWKSRGLDPRGPGLPRSRRGFVPAGNREPLETQQHERVLQHHQAAVGSPPATLPLWQESLLWLHELEPGGWQESVVPHGPTGQKVLTRAGPGRGTGPTSRATRDGEAGGRDKLTRAHAFPGAPGCHASGSLAGLVRSIQKTGGSVSSPPPPGALSKGRVRRTELSVAVRGAHTSCDGPRVRVTSSSSGHTLSQRPCCCPHPALDTQTPLLRLTSKPGSANSLAILWVT